MVSQGAAKENHYAKFGKKGKRKNKAELLEWYERARLVSELRKIEQQRAKQRQIKLAGTRAISNQGRLKDNWNILLVDNKLTNLFANTTKKKKQEIRDNKRSRKR